MATYPNGEGNGNTPQTAGTVLEKYFGADAYKRTFTGNITQQSIADLVGSGQLPRADVQTLTSWQLGTLGSGAYRDLYPEIFKNFTLPSSGYLSREAMQIAALRTMKAEFGGMGGTIIRWLINKKIDYLASRLPVCGSGASGMPPTSEEAPIPDWMQPYIEIGLPYAGQPQTRPTQGTERARGRARGAPSIPERAGQLRPLGAQEELSPEQMEYMAAYGTWGKAGFPTSLQNRNLRDTITYLADQDRFWQPYIALSQKLFPSKVKMAGQWAVAQQR